MATSTWGSSRALAQAGSVDQPRDGRRRTVAVLLTAHNRRESTLRAIQSIFDQQSSWHELDVFLTDDGSIDGTSDAVRHAFPGVHVLRGSGSHFWCGGMRVAWNAALSHEYDRYWWVNDDTFVGAFALGDLDSAVEQAPAHIAVGTVVDPETGTPTYGGLRRTSRLRPLSFELVQPTDQIERCDTMNGNCVLVTGEAVASIGLLDDVFPHAMGDIDYGLRARLAGLTAVVARGVVGTCARNPEVPRAQSARQRLHAVTAVKSLPPGPWRELCRRHGGALWPLIFAKPYIDAFVGRGR